MDKLFRYISLKITEFLHKDFEVYNDFSEEREKIKEEYISVVKDLQQKKDAAQVVKKVINGVSKLEIECGKINVKITVSAGVASIEEAKYIYSLISHADKALYKAKNSGKNRIYT